MSNKIQECLSSALTLIGVSSLYEITFCLMMQVIKKEVLLATSLNLSVEISIDD